MNRPHISVNFAISADGKISPVPHRASGWTSEADHARLLQLREDADALIVGRGTLEADRMTMRAAHHPLRCVISRKGKFDPSHPLFQSEGGPIHLLATEGEADSIPGTTSHRGSLGEFIETLHHDLGVNRLHCEGGGQLIRALAEIDFLDEIHLTWAGHTMFGGATAPGITGPPGGFLSTSAQFEITHFEPASSSGECFLSYRRRRQ